MVCLFVFFSGGGEGGPPLVGPLVWETVFVTQTSSCVDFHCELVVIRRFCIAKFLVLFEYDIDSVQMGTRMRQ